MKQHGLKLFGYFILAIILVTALSVGLPALNGEGWMPAANTDEADRVDALFWGLMVVSILIMSIVSALVMYSVHHFKALPGDDRDEDGEHIHGNHKLELFWIITPILIVTAIAVVSFVVMKQNEDGLYNPEKASAAAADLVVDVRAFSFGWSFDYRNYQRPTEASVEKNGSRAAVYLVPDDAKFYAKETGDLVVPVHKLVRFEIISCSMKEAEGRLRQEQKMRQSAMRHVLGDGNAIPQILTVLDAKKAIEIAERATLDADKKEELVKLLKQADLPKGLCERKYGTPDKVEGEDLDAKNIFKGDTNYIDVNHSFWQPETRLKIDAVAGIPTTVQWTPKHITTPDEHTQVVCAELCGSGHNAMRADMCAVSQDAWGWWATEKNSATTCNTLRYFSCEPDNSDYDGMAKDIAALLTKKPNATCNDMKKEAA